MFRPASSRTGAAFTMIVTGGAPSRAISISSSWTSVPRSARASGQSRADRGCPEAEEVILTLAL
jgi:hypothetical protein